jgi:uncharacterized lipoprotein
MTTVAQLIAHLQTLPQEAEVKCLSEEQCFYDIYTEWKSLNIIDDINVIDLRGSIRIKPEDKNYNKVFVEIGSE